MIRLGAHVRQRLETPPLLDWIHNYINTMGWAPSANEIIEAANFTQPGGMARLGAALEEYGRQQLARLIAS